MKTPISIRNIISVDVSINHIADSLSLPDYVVFELFNAVNISFSSLKMCFYFLFLFCVSSKQQKYVRLQVLTAVWLKVKTSWDVMPCRWANGLRCFEVLSSLYCKAVQVPLDHEGI